MACRGPRAFSADGAARAGTWEANALVVASIEEAVRVAREGGRLDLAKLATFAAPQAER